METIRLEQDKEGNGSFFISESGEQLGEMAISVSGGTLTVHHTEVSSKAEGRGFAKKLLEAMAAHANENNLKVIPQCRFVLTQFNRHPDQYAGLWHKDHKKEE